MNEYPGLPDLQTLTQLANQLFQAGPGTTAEASLPRPADTVPAGLPSGMATPVQSPKFPAEVSTLADSASGYYFADHVRHNPFQHLAIESLPQAITPESLGLPGEKELLQLLTNEPGTSSQSHVNTLGQAPAIPGTDQLNPLSPPDRKHQPFDADAGQLAAQIRLVTEDAALQPRLPADTNKLSHAHPAGFSPQSSSRPDYYFLNAGHSPAAEQAFSKQAFGEQAPQGVFAAEHQGFDINAIRRDFPILSERVNGKPLVWFDNAATTHKPKAVIDRVNYFYEHENSNIHRAAHELAARATDAYETARNTVARFIGAESADQIIFVRGATEGINLLASTFGKQRLGAGDEIILSQLEHHANIVPWHRLASEVGAKLRVIPVDDSGQILLDEFRKLITPRTRLVSITQVSNALGTVTPVKDVITIAHEFGIPVIVDGAQSISHMRVNVQELDADFFVFSGHKVFGPTGIGAVYGKAEHLKHMEPYQSGGNMIADVTFDRILYQDPPNRFEAGTGNIADAVGLGAALEYVERIGIERISRYEHDLLSYATQRIRTIPGIRLIGTAADKASVLSFVLDGYSTEEVGTALNREGIAVRSGHHCAQPILRRFGLETSVRPSFAFYNTCEEIDLMIEVLTQLAYQKRIR